MIKPKITKRKIEGELLDLTTGEVLPKGTTINTVDEDLVIMHSEEYIIIDSKAVNYIMQNFNPADVGRIFRMADMTRGEYNILHKDKKVPHTNATLMEELEYSRSKYSEFMKRLYKKGIIYYIIGVKNDTEVKFIMLNPHLARKRKSLSKECLACFNQLE
jgi:DNA-binding MarR family transcriptional regulator